MHGFLVDGHKWCMERGREKYVMKTKIQFGVPLNLHNDYILSLSILFLFQMYRITVRTSNEAVSRKICDILSEQF